jgi:hypothetical protein
VLSDVVALDWELEPEIAVDPAVIELERLRSIDPMPLRKMVEDFRDGTQEARDIGEKARRYYDNDQIFGETERAWKRSRQPKVIRNEIAPAVNGMLGVIQQAKVDPRAWPRNPGNEEQADVASKALRFVADSQKWHKKKVDAAETFLIEGIAAVAIEASEEGDPLITQLAYDELIYDPHSRRADFSDAAYKGIGKWMYEGDLMRRYPLMREDLSAAFTSSWGAQMGLDRQDKPENLLGTNWLDPKRRRIFVVELYHLEDGEWMRSVFYVGGVLEQGPSPYQDDRGLSLCAFVFQSCLITRDNQRAGLVKAMLSPQDELNAYGSRALHLARSRQLRASDPAFPPEVDARTASAEAAKPDGVIPTGYDMVPTSDLLGGMQMMMGEARQALVRQAPTPAVLADASAANQSGRSRLVLQQAGMTEIARALGRLEDFENEVYRLVWAVLKQFKTEPWWIRITGDDAKKTHHMPINAPVIEGPPGEDGQPTEQQVPPEMVAQMQAQGAPIKIKNELAKMDVDIEVETVPDTANLQAEQFEALAPMLPLLAQAKSPEKAFKIGVMMSSMSEKQKLLEEVDKPDELPPEQAQQQQQMAAMQQQIEQITQELAIRDAKAKIDKTESETALNRAKVEQIDADVTIDAIDTRMKIGAGQPPQPEPMSSGFPPR